MFTDIKITINHTKNTRELLYELILRSHKRGIPVTLSDVRLFCPRQMFRSSPGGACAAPAARDARAPIPAIINITVSITHPR